MECITPRVNPNINYRLQVIKMFQCWVIDCNKCTTHMGDADNGRWEEGEGILGESLHPLLQFSANLKLL